MATLIEVDYKEEENSDEEEEFSDEEGAGEYPEVEEDLEQSLITEGGPETSEALLNLPLDLFVNILSRLSIKPLAVCRCVCKTWRKIVHHPIFTNVHHTTQTTHTLNDTISLLLNLNRNFIDLFEDGDAVNLRFIPSHLKFDFVGSCNGLICLSDNNSNDPIYVCNPVIGEYIILPRTDQGSYWDIAYGFGFDQVSNKYKVIRMISDTFEEKFEAEVYTLGLEEWRKLGKVPYLLHGRSLGIFVNGALHWVTYENSVDSSGVTFSHHILAFDVGIEEFRVVPHPSGLFQTKGDCEVLGDLAGKLCLLDDSYDDWCTIWVMKEYGVACSWVKEYVISRDLAPFSPADFRVIALIRNVYILLLVDSSCLVIYDTVRKNFRKFWAFQDSYNDWLDAITHVGSFVSLKDIIEPKTLNHSVNTGRWYRTLRPVSSLPPKD